MIKFCVWPDDTICDFDFLEEMSFMSDDFIVVELECEDDFVSYDDEIKKLSEVK